MSKKILIIGPSWVGDMVMAQSLFKAIVRQDRNTIIDVLAPEWSLAVVDRMPEVRKKIIMPVVHGGLKLRTRYKIAKSLRAEEYDEAIVLPNSWKSALIPFWAHIPKRTGWRGEMRYGLINDMRYLDKQSLPKMVERFVALAYPKEYVEKNNIKNIEPPCLTVCRESLGKLFTKFLISPKNKQPILALCPGAAFGTAKRWPEEYYIELAKEKVQQGWRVWLFGSPQDMPVIHKIQNAVRNIIRETRQAEDQQNIVDDCMNFAGELDLLTRIDILSVVDVVVTNDSGLMHIAAALNKLVIAIYGPTSAAFTPPLGVKSHILQKDLSCRPCAKRECPKKHHDCMRMIKPQEVNSLIDSVVV